MGKLEQLRSMISILDRVNSYIKSHLSQQKAKNQNKSLTKKDMQQFNCKNSNKQKIKMNMSGVFSGQNDDSKLLSKIINKLSSFPSQFANIIYLIERGGDKIGRRRFSNDKLKGRCCV